ncbi:MAG: helix-turn-helix domain-containing protein [Xanthobacteraceae bacterium]
MKTVLTTADISERKRFQFWQDAVCDTFVELDCQARAETPFFGEITTADCDGLHFSTVRADSQIVRRTRTRIHRAREEVMLISLQVRGAGIVGQDGREARLKPGDFACYDSTRPYTLNFDESFEQLVLHMPREAMMRRIGRTELWTARRIEAASPVGSLVLPFVQRTASIVSDVAPATASRLSETCLSLVTAALGERLGEIGVGGTSARTALIFRAKAVIESNLHDHALNTEKVADLVGISPRYLQDLFHAEGTTVSDWIWKRRLEKSRRDLADPLRASDSIAQIALACGFADFGHFSRRYKEAFGASPREDRAMLRNSRIQTPGAA